MPFIKLWIHLVWATKNRMPLLEKDIRSTIFEHIATNARSKEIYVSAIGGYYDHVHCLISLGTDQTVAKVV